MTQVRLGRQWIQLNEGASRNAECGKDGIQTYKYFLIPPSEFQLPNSRNPEPLKLLTLNHIP